MLRKDLEEARSMESKVSGALHDTPADLLDLPVYSGYVYFYTRGDQECMAYNAELGEYKNAPEFKGTSTRLLNLSAKERVVTNPNSFRPGRMEQVFLIDESTTVTLGWTDPERKGKPCHTVTVVRNVEIVWCGDGPAPIQDGDVIIGGDDNG